VYVDVVVDGWVLLMGSYVVVVLWCCGVVVLWCCGEVVRVFNRATVNMRPHATTRYLLVFCGRILETTRQRRLTTSRGVCL